MENNSQPGIINIALEYKHRGFFKWLEEDLSFIQYHVNLSDQDLRSWIEKVYGPYEVSTPKSRFNRMSGTNTCPKCRSNTFRRISVQARKCDEASTILLTCVSCGSTLH
jgi:DNA-directed RNA polymerase subunit M/transcription elongation factor TFIIS